MSAVIHAGMPMRRTDNRAINYAVLGSLLLHGALLFSFSMKPSKSPPSTPGPIVARLQPLAKPAAAPQPEPPKPRVEEPAPAPPPPQVKPVPQPKPSPIVRPEPKAAKPAPEVKPEPVPPPQPAPTAAAPPPSAPATPAAPGPVARTDPTPPAPTADSGTLDQYRLELMAMARNYKRYPRVAMDNNWEGRVLIRMVIGASGMISTITIVSSAGHDILDKQALDMIQKAKPRVQIPPALRGKEFTLEIPVIYSLKDAGAG